MKAIKHPSLTNLVEELIQRVPEVNSYTANRMDPTLVTIQELQVGKFIKIEIMNAWGSELKIRVGKNTLVGLYIDEDGIFLRKPLSRLQIKYMRALVKRFPVIERERYNECDECDPAGGYGLYSHE